MSSAMHSSCLALIIFLLIFGATTLKKKLPEKSRQFKTKEWGRSSLSSPLPFTGTLMTLTTLHFKRMLCFRAVLTTFYALETHSGLSASGNTAPFPWHHGLSSGRQTSSQAFFCFVFFFLLPGQTIRLQNRLSKLDLNT